MTVPSETSRSGPYNGNGSTTVFAYGFRILDETHIQVIRRSAAGVETVLTLSTDYTVSGVGASGGGSVTTTVAPASGTTITILRSAPFTQETDLQNQGAYYAETIEDALDAAAMRDQQLGERLDRAVVIPASSDAAQLDNLVADILLLANISDDISTVATNSADVSTVADYAAIIAANLTDITNFADVYQGAKASDPTLRNDGSALQAGDLYFNTTTSVMRVRSAGSWIDAGAAPINLVANSFTGNGSQTAYTLSASPGAVQNVLVWVGGVKQQPTVSYTVSGTTLTFASAPANLALIETLVVLATSTIAVPADASVTTAKIAANALSADAAGRAKMADGFLTREKLAARIAFKANKNGTNQTGIVSATETKVTFGTEDFDSGSYYDTTNSRWTPPAGPVFLNSVCQMAGTLSATAQLAYLVIYKNGVAFAYGPSVRGANTGNSAANVTATDLANGTDYYEVFANITTSAGTGTITGTASGARFEGFCL